MCYNALHDNGGTFKPMGDTIMETAMPRVEIGTVNVAQFTVDIDPIDYGSGNVDFVVRLNGNIVVVIQDNNLSEAREVADRLVRALRNPNVSKVGL